MIGAILNIGLNLIFIPVYGSITAAATTLISEFVTFLIQIYFVNQSRTFKYEVKSCFKSIVSCLVMGAVCNIIKVQFNHVLLVVMATFFAGVLTYMTCNYIMKNLIILDLFEKLKHKRNTLFGR